MSRKRPTEVSWDSDDDLLQDDLSGINAFPHSKKEETEEELDEDALLGSDDEATDKQVNTSDMCDSANADMSTSDAGNTTFGVPETDDYEFADVSQELGEDVLVIEPEVDSSLLNDTQEEGDQLEEDVDYREGEFDGGSELDSTADTQPGPDTTDGGVGADEGEGSSSESESDGEGGRARFKSERAAIVSLSQSKSRTDIPDTLEISEEQQATIDEFLTKDGRKKKQRGGFQRGGRSQAQQRRPMSGPAGYSHQPSRYPTPHMMQASHRAEFSPHHPTKQKPLLMSGPQNPPFVDSLSSQARPRKILINPHFRGPSASTAAPDTTVTWSHHPSRQRHSAPQLPQVPNTPSFPAPVHQAQYPVREQPTYNGQPQPALLAFPEPHRGPETIRGHEHHMGHDPHRGHVPLFAMGSHSAPSHPRGMPQQQAFSSGPPHSYHEQQGLYHGYNSQRPHIGLSQPGYPQHRPITQQYDQAHALPSRGLAPGPMQPLLSNSPQRGMSSLPLGRPPHQLRPDQSHLNAPRQEFMTHHPASRPSDNQPFFGSSANQAYRQGQVASGLPNQPSLSGSHSQGLPYQANNNRFHSPQRQQQQQQQHQANTQRDPAIQFGLLPPPRQTFSSSPGSSQGHSAQFTGPRPFPQQQQQQRQPQSGMVSQFQQAQMQNRGKGFPRGQMVQPLQRRSRPGVVPQGQTNNNNNNITLVNAAPQKRLSGEVITGSSPPKVSRKTERKNVKDRLQLPSKQKQTDIQIQQQQQPPPSEHPAPVIQPKEPEEALDEETRLLNEKIEEQKRLRAEIIKRKEARRLQQAKQRRLELQKKLAEQGMTLSDVDASSDNSSPQKQAHAEPDAQQQPAPQKVFVPTKMAASKTGQMIATKRQGGSMGTVQTFQKEPPSKVPRQMSQPLQQGQGQMGTQPNRSGHQPGTQGRFSRQNSRGQGSFVRGQRGMRRGAVTRQMSGGNVGQTQLTPSQLQARQVKLEQSSQAFENQANRNVVSLTEQDHGGASQGHVVKGQGPVRGRGQMNRGQFGKSRGGHLPLRGRGQTVSRGQGHSVQRGPGHGVQRQTSGGQGERTVMARSMSGNNIVLGESQTTQADTAANRRVVVGPNVNKGGSSQFISIDNLSKSTTQQKLYKLCRTVGPVENVQLLQSQNKAIVKFQNPGHGHKFAQKYDRHLLDLSSIRISTLPS